MFGFRKKDKNKDQPQGPGRGGQGQDGKGQDGQGQGGQVQDGQGHGGSGQDGLGQPAASQPAAVATPLRIPPFAPDAETPALVDVPIPQDPAAAYAALGLSLPPITFKGQTGPGTPVWTIAVEDGEGIFQLWSDLRDRHPQTGLWPLVITEDLWETTDFELGEESDSIGIDAGDGKTWMDEHFADRSDGGTIEDIVHLGPPPELGQTDAPWWLVAEASAGGDQIALVPVAAGWQAPGALGWSGAANAELDGSDHATVLRRWNGHWGAEVLGLSFDMLSVRLTRPPETAEQALTLAAETYLYCSDSVDQGTTHLGGLASVVALPAWTLWWD